MIPPRKASLTEISRPTGSAKKHRLPSIISGLLTSIGKTSQEALIPKKNFKIGNSVFG
jgi:hypothetical protein